jgi:predicted O-methyltransferase YrrM
MVDFEDFSAAVLRRSRERDATVEERAERYRNLHPAAARVLSELVSGLNAQDVLEIGTANGYSTMWIAHALPSTGRLLTVEKHEGRAAEAAENLAAAGLSSRIEQRIGDALEVLSDLHGSFDLIFLDADRSAYLDYLPHLLRVLDGLLVVDNVISHEDQTAEFEAALRDTAGFSVLKLCIGSGLLLAQRADDL